ncbi:hypothetical protein Tco_0166767, partial [Tanacetum coccineum]
MKEVRKKSLRDFHKTHPSGFGTSARKPPSVEKITHAVTSEGTGDKPGVLDVTEDNSTESLSLRVMIKMIATMNKRQVMKAVDRRMKVKSKNLIQSKMK